MLGAIVSEEGLQNGCRSIRMEESEDLLHCALDFPADCVSAAHLLSPCMQGGREWGNKNRYSSSPEATGTVVVRSSVTPMLQKAFEAFLCPTNCLSEGLRI